jgi:hypothetical protein
VYAYAYGLVKAEPNIKVRLNNNLMYVDKMSIEMATMTAATCAIGAVQGVLLALVHHLEQEKVLVCPRQRLAHLNVPYKKKHLFWSSSPMINASFISGKFTDSSVYGVVFLIVYSFTKSHIRQISKVLHLEVYKLNGRTKATPEVALCVLCYVLARPRSLRSAPTIFRRFYYWCSTFATSVLIYIRDQFQDLVRWDPRRLTLTQLQEYAAYVERCNRPDNVWGFVDGTLRGISRPIE